MRSFTPEEVVELRRNYYDKLPSVEMLYNATAFRNVKQGDYYLPNTDVEKITRCGEHFLPEGKRLIFNQPKEVIDGTFPTVITVNEVYGGKVEIPDRYKFVRFGPVNPNELFLSSRFCEVLTGPSDAPRIIVAKKD